MTIAVSQATAQAYANSSSVTTASMTSVSNSLIVLAAGAYNGGGLSGVTFTPSDSKSGTWSTASALIGDATSWAALYYNLGGSRGTNHTFSVGMDTTAQISLVAIEITDVMQTSVLDQAASDSQTTGTATVSTSATSNAADLVIANAVTRGASGTVNWAANGTITGSNGTDILLDNDGATHGAGHAIFYRVVGATGVQTGARSHDAVSSDWTIAVAAFKQFQGNFALLRMLTEHS